MFSTSVRNHPNTSNLFFLFIAINFSIKYSESLAIISEKSHLIFVLMRINIEIIKVKYFSIHICIHKSFWREKKKNNKHEQTWPQRTVKSFLMPTREKFRNLRTKKTMNIPRTSVSFLWKLLEKSKHSFSYLI